MHAYDVGLFTDMLKSHMQVYTSTNIYGDSRLFCEAS